MSTVYTLNGKVLKNAATDKWLAKKELDPYNPLGLPPNTVRVRTSDGQPPQKLTGGWYNTMYDTATLVPGTSDVYDVYKSGADFTRLLWFQVDDMYLNNNVVEILGANTTGITNMSSMFEGCNISTAPLFDTTSVTNMASMFTHCYNLESVPLYDTHNVTNFNRMFAGYTVGEYSSNKSIKLRSIPNFNTSNATNFAFFACRTLIESIPLLDTSKVTNVNGMFQDCVNVNSGALALYQQMSAQTTPPSSYTNAFLNCGSNTVTGAAELAQIPSSWGGTGA